MAWFSYKCPEHGEFRVSLPKREKKVKCPTCSVESGAIIRAGGVQIVERLDNGAMARTVERLHNIEEIMNERADKFAKKRDD
jgi:hypothetical protein